MNIRLVKWEGFCGAIALTYFVEKSLRFTLTALWKKDISRILAILFPKINECTCDKMLKAYAQMDVYS